MPHTEDLVNSIEWVPYLVLQANNARDGTGTPNWVFRPKEKTVFFRRVRIQPAGNNVATVARLFINNGDDHTVPANNILFDEVTCPATTTTSHAAQITYVPITVNLWLTAGRRVNVTFGILDAPGTDAGFYLSSIAGQYSESVGDPKLYA